MKLQDKFEQVIGAPRPRALLDSYWIAKNMEEDTRKPAIQTCEHSCRKIEKSVGKLKD